MLPRLQVFFFFHLALTEQLALCRFRGPALPHLPGGAGLRMGYVCPCFALQLSLYCFYPLPLATGVLGEVCTAFLLFRSNKF